MAEKQKYIRLIIIAGLVVILDQITKEIIMQTMPVSRSLSVIPGFFNLTHVQNPGGAFGFLAQQSNLVRKFVFIFISLIAAGLVLWFYQKTPKPYPFLAAGFALIFGGAVGNLIDRIRFGRVVDFLDVYVGAYHWPAFNVADSAITIGIGIFVFHLLFREIPE